MQKTTVFTKLLSCILCVMLIAAAVMMLPGCSDNNPETPAASDTAAGTQADATAAGTTDETAAETGSTLGEGEKQFTFIVIDKDKNKTEFTIKTDKKTVGEALVDVNLIEGEQGAYGLYVKKVNGITADYDANGEWWGFYVNGEMSMTGVDSTDVTPGAVYEFRVEK